MISWTKPSGLTVQTIEDKVTVAYCESLGWKRDGAVVEPDDGLTVEAINKMRKAGLMKLAKSENLTVDKTLSVLDMRCAVIDALFEPE